MKKKILIIGSKGMAGHVLYHYFKALPDFEVVDISRSNDFFTSTYTIDVNDTVALSNIFEQEKPFAVINGVGILNKDAEDHPDKAIFFNSYLPHFLAKEGAKNNFKLIHISTDCVFNGEKGDYIESDTKNGYGFYAQSKALGEVDYGQHLTIRTSIIGPELKNTGIGLYHWFMKQSGTITGYTKAFWGGVTTLELAKAVEAALRQNITGLIHLTNGNKIAKFDLLNVFEAVFKTANKNIIPYEGKIVDKSLKSTRHDFDYSVASYEEMVTDMHTMMQENEERYRENYNLA